AELKAAVPRRGGNGVRGLGIDGERGAGRLRRDHDRGRLRGGRRLILVVLDTASNENRGEDRRAEPERPASNVRHVRDPGSGGQTSALARDQEGSLNIVAAKSQTTVAALF